MRFFLKTLLVYQKVILSLGFRCAEGVRILIIDVDIYQKRRIEKYYVSYGTGTE